MSELQAKIKQSLVWAEHQARVDCELRGGDVGEHWASIISSQLEALTEHNRLLQLENEQLAKDKAELVEALQGILAVIGESTGVVGYHLNGDTADWDEFEEVENIYAAMEKHKCD